MEKFKLVSNDLEIVPTQGGIIERRTTVTEKIITTQDIDNELAAILLEKANLEAKETALKDKKTQII